MGKRKRVSDDQVVIENNNVNNEEPKLKKKKIQTPPEQSITNDQTTDTNEKQLNEKKKKKAKKYRNHQEEEEEKEKDKIEEKVEVEKIEGFDKNHPAIIYLTAWNKDRTNWKFKKKQQVWLFKNMYDKTKIDKKRFKMLIEYLKGLKGNQRKVLLEEAETFIKEIDNIDDENEIDKFQELRYRRSRVVTQTLMNEP